MHLSFTTALTEVEIQARTILIEPWPPIVFHFESKNKELTSKFSKQQQILRFLHPEKVRKES